MKLQHLKFFVAVVDRGGVIKAAEHLHLTQPGVSAGLKALERELGCLLFERSRGGRNIRLTPAGRRFHPRALSILKECDSARTEARGQEQRKRRLRIGLLNTLPQTFVADFTAALRAADPQQMIEFWESTAARLSGWMAQERLEAAITVVEGLNPNVQVLWYDPDVAVVARNHPLANRQHGIITIKELTAEPFVLRSHCELRPATENRFRALGSTVRIVVRAESDALAFMAVTQGIGLSMGPSSLVPQHLVPLTIREFSLGRTIGIEWRRGMTDDIREYVHGAAVEATNVLPFIKGNKKERHIKKSAPKATQGASKTRRRSRPL